MQSSVVQSFAPAQTYQLLTHYLLKILKSEYQYHSIKQPIIMKSSITFISALALAAAHPPSLEKLKSATEVARVSTGSSTTSGSAGGGGSLTEWAAAGPHDRGLLSL